MAKCRLLPAILLVTLLSLTLSITYADQGSFDQPKTLAFIKRNIPVAGPDHPGNVYLLGEKVKVKFPLGIGLEASKWQLTDDKNKIIKKGNLKRKAKFDVKDIEVGKLGIGWYRMDFLDEKDTLVDWTTCAVLAKLKAPTPQDSPVCIDAAIAWFAKKDFAGQERFAKLAALAGVNWTRDRISLREMEKEKLLFVGKSNYDTASALQAKYGLKILHCVPTRSKWTVDDEMDGKRGRQFPRDLRDVYKTCKLFAERFKNTVQAWESGNEANADNFGAHTIDEIVTHQKVVYLGIKAGNPNAIVAGCSSGGVPSQLTTDGYLLNETWPYYEVYSIHSYDWPNAYDKLWEPSIQAACGRPIWLTEADRGMDYNSEHPWCDYTRENAQRKAEHMAHSYASSIYNGVDKHFHFCLGHYIEDMPTRNSQFGLLRLDMTPRPSYVALAAIGRFMAGAKSIGRLKPDEIANIYAFRAKPDGIESDVLVCWAQNPDGGWETKGNIHYKWSAPNDLQIKGIYDYLGRQLEKMPDELTDEAVFVVLEKDQAKKLNLETKKIAEYRTGKPCPVILQVQIPAADTQGTYENWVEIQEHGIEVNKPRDIVLYAYNFTDKVVEGTVELLDPPSGLEFSPKQWKVSIEPMDRTQLIAAVTIPDWPSDMMDKNWIKLKGRFGDIGEPVLAFKLVAKKDKPAEENH
ncbi:MAG TPA: hypothetical protein PLP05_04735 [Sedimentisphaerales bacterium]|nr:hypothetical protein [Sedimentisphaerales bacterium]